MINKTLHVANIKCGGCAQNISSKLSILTAKKKTTMTIQERIQNGAKVVDVRTSEEFMRRKVTGSINIPLNEVQQRISEFKAIGAPIILCCLSGVRSGQALGFLQAQGIECYNGGGYMDVEVAISQDA
jgi:phage shock protein E